MDNVLCIPTIKKNFIYISQWCATNDASVELFSSSFNMKDLCTGAILLKGITKDGVYEWPAAEPGSSPILALTRWFQILCYFLQDQKIDVLSQVQECRSNK